MLRTREIDGLLSTLSSKQYWIIFVAAAGMLSACDGRLAFGGPVKEVAPRKLSGGFQILEVSKSYGGVDSDGKGGACILVAMNDVPGYEQMKCTAPSRQCAPGPAGMLWTLWFTYCDLPPNAQDGAEGQCWGKPENRPVLLQQQLEKQFCNRSKDYNPPHIWPIGADNPANQEPIDLTQEVLGGLASPSRWRINACVLRSDNNQLECRWGSITEIP